MIAFILGVLAGVFGHRQFVALSTLASPELAPQIWLIRGSGQRPFHKNILFTCYKQIL